MPGREGQIHHHRDQDVDDESEQSDVHRELERPEVEGARRLAQLRGAL